MSAKSFLYLSAGILFLVTAHNIGTRKASASFVDHSAPVVLAYRSLNVLRSDGQHWGWSERDGGWIQITNVNEDPLPVELGEVAFWESGSLITRAGVLWRLDPNSGPPRQWVNLGQLPSPTVAVEAESMGAVKSKYRR